MSDLTALLRHRIVPVVVLSEFETAVPTAAALKGGGLPVAEVTFRTNTAVEAIRAIAAGNGLPASGPARSCGRSRSTRRSRRAPGSS